MTEDQPLTPQEVADTLRIAKNTVYELVKRGELAAYRVGNKFRFHRRDVEAYQRSGGVRSAESPQGHLLPRELEASPGERPFVLAGQDLLLDLLAQRLEAHPLGCRVFRSYLGSYNGLHALYQGSVQAATAHLWDGTTNTYNLPFLPYMLPGLPVVVVHLALRTVGYYVARGNPRGLKSWGDLGRPDLVLINRERGSGMRVLLDERLRLAALATHQVAGYDHVCTTHLAAAAAVAQGAGHYALGSEKASRQVDGVDFVPLQQERYELVFARESLALGPFQALLELVQSDGFRAELGALGGYGTAETGRLMTGPTR